MKEIILCKYGEIALKGANRNHFEKLLRDILKRRTEPFGKFKIYSVQSTVYIEPLEEYADVEGAYIAAKNTFGISAVSRAIETEKDMGAILETVKTQFMPYIEDAKTFKVEAKRSDKKFPLKSPEISAEVGAAILEASGGHKRVDVHHPDVAVRVEIRDYAAYICAGQERAIGGMPIGSNGKGLLLLSGGIDSPVAGFMIAKRGVRLDAMHFESFPYTSERAREKVLALAEKLTAYTGDIHVHIISVTKIQEVLRDTCEEDYFTLLLRRFMMRLSERTAEKFACDALITGESLGQVASQTMQALGVTNSVVSRPVFRPCIGMDKEEIIRISREIDTFETSILPYEDCCTVFTPRHPRTRPELWKVEREEEKVDVKALEDEAFATLETVVIKHHA
ncbi:MAG: tRNA 4-thiouridine(8) synthase ThiI [Clostridia bacterium]|nr:tRNA 4-thiouridine(8) synthase ThiI [Clostridia bacterium]MBP3554399.1 tRNA 4-thiouridine(8) synthase ThiI [Clostridia bacterium]MBQ8419679.1 tRNA 4-thiouridine(8) synthase ThiI [Clostridia bacterium]